MSISDILAFFDIFVTILLGYYITHRVNVRDSRTRMVKEHYIYELKTIRSMVDSFFLDLYKGNLDGRQISDWYGHQQQILTSFDDGLRMALPIKKKKIEDVVNSIHETITGSDYFNDHFADEHYRMDNAEKPVVIRLQENVNTEFNEYLVQINNSRQFNLWELIRERFKYELQYHQSIKVKCPRCKIFCIWSIKFIAYLLIILFLASLCFKAYASYKEKLEEDKMKFEQEILYRESISRELIKQNSKFEELVDHLEEISNKKADIIVEVPGGCCQN